MTTPEDGGVDGIPGRHISRPEYPAETTRTVVAGRAEGFIGIFKRLYRAMKESFGKLYNLNQVYLQEGTTVYYDASGERQKILSLDYLPDAKTVCPMADPNMVTDMQRIQQAQFLKQSPP